MKLRRKAVLWSLALAGACVTAGVAIALAPQATIIGDLPMHYVPIEATGQIPCPIAATAPAHPERFPNRLLVGNWMLRTERGTTSCIFHTTDAGYCGFGNPGHLVLEQSGVPTIYDIPNGSGAELEIRDGRHACRMGRRIRTHGDTIVPNR